MTKLRALEPSKGCRHCGELAAAVYAMDRGCTVFPDDREQALCPHHIRRVTPLGSMELVEDLTRFGIYTKSSRWSRGAGLELGALEEC